MGTSAALSVILKKDMAGHRFLLCLAVSIYCAAAVAGNLVLHTDNSDYFVPPEGAQSVFGGGLDEDIQELMVRFTKSIDATKRADLIQAFESAGCDPQELVVGDYFDGVLLKNFENCSPSSMDIRSLEGVSTASSNERVYSSYSWTNTQGGAWWGLDRVDQMSLPLNGQYGYNYDGTGVDAWVLDTGVRSTHNQFGGRATLTYDRYPNPTEDCHGHGTHVSGIVGSNTYGVAKNVNIHGVRVLDCTGIGYTSDVIASIVYVMNQTSTATNPFIINMSLGTSTRSQSESLDNVIQDAVDMGIFVTVSAGNAGDDACFYSKNAISKITPLAVVGASDSTDTRAQFTSPQASNWGRCVNVWAPGKGIRSAYKTSDTSLASMSGTSQAAPHVAGAAALYLEQYGASSPTSVLDSIITAAVPNTISDAGHAATQRLLQTYFATPGSSSVLGDPCIPGTECNKFQLTIPSNVAHTEYFPSASGFTTYSRTYMYGWLMGPDGTLGRNLNLELELQMDSGSGWTTIEESASHTSSEKIIEVQNAGLFRWKVSSTCSTCGSAAYTFYNQEGTYIHSGPSATTTLADHCSASQDPSMASFALDEWVSTRCWVFQPQAATNYTIATHTSGDLASCPGDTLLAIYDCGSSACNSGSNPGTLLGADDNSGVGTCSSVHIDGTSYTGTNYYMACAMVKYSASATSVTPIYDVELSWEVTGDESTCENCTEICGSFKGDPHFTGFLGQRFEFQGRPDEVFNLISDTHVQLNARFVDNSGRGDAGTFVSEVGVRTAAGTISARCENNRLRIDLNGERMDVDTTELLEDGSVVGLSSATQNMASIAVPSFEFHIQTASTKFVGCYLNMDAKYSPTDELPLPHGVLGQTAVAAAPKEMDGNAPSKFWDGVFEIEGSEDDYHVGNDDLFGTDFTFNRFQSVMRDEHMGGRSLLWAKSPTATVPAGIGRRLLACDCN